MIRSGQKLRLNEQDKAHVGLLAGARPEHVKTVEGFNRFLDIQKMKYMGDTSEEKLLRHLFDASKLKP